MPKQDTTTCQQGKKTEKGKTNWRVKGALLILYLILKKKARDFQLVLIAAGSLTPGTVRIDQ